jgi:hypothetical protein
MQAARWPAKDEGPAAQTQGPDREGRDRERQ